MKVKKAVILAGGLGTRLSEETDLIPKPMVQIGQRPILWHIMKYYSCFGINEFIVCCGHKGQIIKAVALGMFDSNVVWHIKAKARVEVEGISYPQKLIAYKKVDDQKASPEKATDWHTETLKR